MPIAQLRLPAQSRQFAIDFVGCDRAALDVDQTMRIAPKKTDHAILDVDRDPIAVTVGERRGDNRPERDLVELADPLENIADLSPLDGELVFIIDVLIGAAATTSEIGTLRRDSMR